MLFIFHIASITILNIWLCYQVFDLLVYDHVVVTIAQKTNF